MRRKSPYFAQAQHVPPPLVFRIRRFGVYKNDTLFRSARLYRRSPTTTTTHPPGSRNLGKLTPGDYLHLLRTTIDVADRLFASTQGD